MVEAIPTKESVKLSDYESFAYLTSAVHELRKEAEVLVPQLKGKKVYMVNSTAAGGGVAEMMPRMISIFRELGVDIEWLVMSPDKEEFFGLTKKLHNLIHGSGDPNLSESEQELYNSVSRYVANGLKEFVKPEDILVIHDPQPMGAGAILKKEMGLPAIWRCHIGLDEHLPQTRTAWKFLEQHAGPYDHAVFSAPEYIPTYFAGKSSIIFPALDPLSHKNRAISAHKLVGILVNSGLAKEHNPVLTSEFDHKAQRLMPDGSFQTATSPEELGLLFRPIITQVSRWDRLKGFKPLLEGFTLLKKRLKSGELKVEGRQKRRLEIVRLLMVGPDPASIQDDPEGQEVLHDLINFYTSLDNDIQQDVALITLPMNSLKENALMVNAIQRCTTIGVQNSLREGFGLTATELMLKGIPIMAANACGLRLQVRDGIDGRVIQDAENKEEIATTLNEMLADVPNRQNWAKNSEKRVFDEFLVFTQIRNWLRVIANTVNKVSS